MDVGAPTITTEKWEVHPAFRKAGKALAQEPPRQLGQWNAVDSSTGQRRGFYRRKSGNIIFPSVLVAGVNPTRPQRAKGKRVAKRAPNPTRGRWNRDLRWMDRLNRAHLSYPRRFNKDRRLRESQRSEIGYGRLG